MPGAPLVREVIETERDLGGGLIAGGVAFRIFLWLVPLGLVVAALLSFWVEHSETRSRTSRATSASVLPPQSRQLARSRAATEMPASCSRWASRHSRGSPSRRSGADPRLRPRLAAQAAPDPAAVSRDRDLQRPVRRLHGPHQRWLGYGSTSGRSPSWEPLSRLPPRPGWRWTAMWLLPRRPTTPPAPPGALLVAVGAQLIQIAVLFYFAPRLGRRGDVRRARHSGHAPHLALRDQPLVHWRRASTRRSGFVATRRMRQLRRISTRESPVPLRTGRGGRTGRGAGRVGAALADERELAERYAPVVRLVEQEEECGHGEPYEPIDVDILFDERTVALRGPWNPVDLVKIAPVAADLDGLYRYHLDFPATRSIRAATTSLGPPDRRGERADRLRPRGRRSRPPRQARAQYWLFYVYNDWNNLHEGDWEMIQLVFEAEDAREALSQEPVSIGYSQHEAARPRAGTTRSSSSSTGGTPSSIPPPDRTPISSTRRSTSAAPLSRASAATTRGDRTTSSGRR